MKDTDTHTVAVDFSDCPRDPREAPLKVNYEKYHLRQNVNCPRDPREAPLKVWVIAERPAERQIAPGTPGRPR